MDVDLFFSRAQPPAICGNLELYVCVCGGGVAGVGAQLTFIDPHSTNNSNQLTALSFILFLFRRQG